MVWEAIQAGEELEKEGISAEIINIHTIKPLDTNAILESVNKTSCIVSAEEHQKAGGLGESIASFLSQNRPTPMEMVAINDEWGQSGKPAALMEKYDLTAASIRDAAKRLVAQKA